MQVIRIEGVKEDANTIQSSLEGFLSDYPIFIINREKVLYKFIEELEVDDRVLFRLKIAREIDFRDISVTLRDKTTNDTIIDNISSLSSLIEGLDEDIVKNCTLILDIEDNVLISEITQALIYLNIELEVMMKKEIIDRKVLNAFKRQFDKIRETVINGEKALYNLDVNDEFLNERNNLLNLFNDIRNDLEEARDRSLNISIMATKKAGKSVVVNSFLNEQYAPTSLELPTPNTCIYKKSIDNNIRLLYGESDILFKTPEDIYKYTYNEFKKAQNDKEQGYTIEDMEIHYRDTNNSFTSFTVIDTPGSNYALAKDISSGENLHKRITYKWIQKSDVVLFLVNYSSYLTIDEEKLFKKIKIEFEKSNKFYSLVVVVNKLDEMYMSECENKSVVRFLDYLRCKLNDLGYSRFVVMGTSARSYFDIIKVGRIDKDIRESLGETIPIENLKGSMLRERLKKLKEKFIGKNEMTSLSFVDEQLERLECFYGLKDYDLDTLREKSGMPKLIEYTTYIAMQKAHLEVYGSLIRNIDEKYLKFKNRRVLNSLTDLKKEKVDEVEEIEEILRDIIDGFDNIKNDMEENLSFENFKNDLLSKIQISKEKRIKYISDLCEKRIDEFFTKLLLKNSDELRNLKNKTIDIDLTINNKLFNEELNAITEEFLKELNIELDRKQEYLKEAERNMKRLIQTFNEIVNKEYDLEDFNIEVPKVDQYYKKLLQVNMPSIYILDNNVKEKILNSIEIKGNFVGKLFSSFIRNKLELYSIKSNQLKEIKKDYMEYLKNYTSNQYCIYYNSLSEKLLKCIDDYTGKINGYFLNTKTTYENIVSDVLGNLSDSKRNIDNQLDDLDKKILFYDEIHKAAKDFISEWNIIRDM